MRTRSLVLAVLLCSVTLPVLAQDKPADTMQILREKIQADKKLLVATNMDLTEKEAQAFWPIYASARRYRKRRWPDTSRSRTRSRRSSATSLRGRFPWSSNPGDSDQRERERVEESHGHRVQGWRRRKVAK
jgi:hypothetical protein